MRLAVAPTPCPAQSCLYVPIRTGRGAVGVIGLDGERPGPLFDARQRRLLDALSDQAALAIERIISPRRCRPGPGSRRKPSGCARRCSPRSRTICARRSRRSSARPRACKTYRASARERRRRRAIATIQEEAERLNRFIANLLDMTRLESGAIEPRTSIVDLADDRRQRAQRAAKILARHRVEIDLPPDLPMLKLDPVLFEQVLFNLLDNAAKYSPAGIEDRSGAPREASCVSSLDEGEGIPARRSRTHLRQILSGAGGRSEARRHRAWARDLPRLCRGDGRHDQRRQPRQTGTGAVFIITLPVPGRRRRTDDAA